MTTMLKAPKSRAEVPYFVPLAEMYRSWVPELCKVLEAQQKYIEAHAEYLAAKDLPLVKEDMLDMAFL